MDIPLWADLVVMGSGAVGAVITALVAWRKVTFARAEATRTARWKCLEGYSMLVNDLREMVEANNTELARLREELRELDENYRSLETRYRADQERWAEERQALQARIDELVRIKASLERQQKEAEG